MSSDLPHSGTNTVPSAGACTDGQYACKASLVDSWLNPMSFNFHLLSQNSAFMTLLKLFCWMRPIASRMAIASHSLPMSINGSSSRTITSADSADVDNACRFPFTRFLRRCKAKRADVSVVLSWNVFRNSRRYTALMPQSGMSSSFALYWSISPVRAIRPNCHRHPVRAYPKFDLISSGTG